VLLQRLLRLLLDFNLLNCHVGIHRCSFLKMARNSFRSAISIKQLHSTHLNCFSQSFVVINGIAIGLYRNLLLNARFYDAIAFGFVLQSKKKKVNKDSTKLN